MNPVTQLVLTGLEVFFDGAPDEFSVKDHIGAMFGVNQGGSLKDRFFWVDDVIEHFVLNVHQLCCILSQSARLGHDCCDPFSCIPGGSNGQRIACHLGCIHTRQDRVNGIKEFLTREDRMNTGHVQCLLGINAQNIGACIGARDECHMQHACAVNVCSVLPLTHHEALVFNSAAMTSNVFEGGLIS